MKKHILVSCLACLVLSASAAADATASLCALRFGYRYTQPDKWPEMRAALEKNRAAFDEIWFSTGVSFPSLAWHEEHARQCAIRVLPPTSRGSPNCTRTGSPVRCGSTTTCPTATGLRF